MVREANNGFFLIELMICFVALTLFLVSVMQVRATVINKTIQAQYLLEATQEIKQASWYAARNRHQEFALKNPKQDIRVVSSHVVTFVLSNCADKGTIMLKQSLINITLKENKEAHPFPHSFWVAVV